MAALGEMGNIASMIQEEEDEKTPMQKELDRVGEELAAGGIAVAIAVGLIGYILLGWPECHPARANHKINYRLCRTAWPQDLPIFV